MKLVVTHDFADYKVGNEITDAGAVAKILESEQAQYVVKVADQPDAAPADAAPSKRSK